VHVIHIYIKRWHNRDAHFCIQNFVTTKKSVTVFG